MNGQVVEEETVFHCDHDETIGPHECPQLLRTNGSPKVTFARSKRSGHEEQDCCGLTIQFVSFVLFIFHFIFLTSGVVILAVCFFMTTPAASTIRCLLPSRHANNIVFRSMVLIGILICITATLNLLMTLFKTKKTSHVVCFLIFSLLFLFTLQLTTSFVGFVSITDVQSQLIHDDQNYTRLLENMFQEKSSPSKILVSHRQAFDIIESNLKCCGLYDYTDYDGDVPSSCCRSPSPDCGSRKHPSNIYYDGCFDPIHTATRDELNLLSSVALGLSFVQVFGLIFSCCLYIQLSTTTMSTSRERYV